jgi:pimeloyl-ACP methyl ester carboxylesterase
MGSAAAMFAAAELGNSVQGYIIECPYQNLSIAARNRTKMVLPWGLEWIAYCGLRCVAPLVVSDADKISPVDAVAAVPKNVPALVMAGKLDPLATPAEAEAIHDRIKDHATLELFERAGHIQCGASEPVRYAALVLGFIDGCARKVRTP